MISAGRDLRQEANEPLKNGWPTIHAYCGILLFALSGLTGCQSVPPESQSKPREAEGSKSVAINQLPGTYSSLGAYDASVIEAIKLQWYDAISAQTSTIGTGKIQVTFVLHDDGKVTDVRVVENTGTDIQAAIVVRVVQQLAPYPAWPEDVREKIGKDSRQITFTFHYR